MNRHNEREQTFVLVFESLFNIYDPKTILELACQVRSLESCEGYVEDTFLGICEKKDEICEIISGNLKGWTINRISKVSLAILLLAIYELKYSDSVPSSVSINEAVELAKLYGCENDRSFVNGVLSSVFKQLELEK